MSRQPSNAPAGREDAVGGAAATPIEPGVLTIDQALAALARNGHAPRASDGRGHCPLCTSEWTLAISQNGNGAHLTCDSGCDSEHIRGALLAERNRARLADTPSSKLDQLRAQLKLPGLSRVIKRGKDGDAYDLELDDGRRIELGSASDLLRHHHMKAAILGKADVLIKPRKPAEHEAVVELLVQTAELDDQVMTTDEETRAWLGAYVSETHVATLDLNDSGALYEYLGNLSCLGPFIADGRLHVRLRNIATWLNRTGGGRVTVPELSMRLARLKFETTQPSARNGDQTRKARYWRSPAGFEVER